MLYFRFNLNNKLVQIIESIKFCENFMEKRFYLLKKCYNGNQLLK